MKLLYLFAYLLFSCTSASSIQNFDYAEKIRVYVEGGLEIYITIKVEYLNNSYDVVLKTTELYSSFDNFDKMDYQKDFSKMLCEILSNKRSLQVDTKQYGLLKKYIINDSNKMNYTRKEILNSLDEYGFIKYPYNDLRTQSIIYYLANKEIIVSEGDRGPRVKKELLEKN